ncbi:MAG: Rieske 2Fe-2S domain-containing protein [Mycobacteriales bacterium]
MAKKRGMSRRDFFRTTWLAGMGLGLGGFAAASLGFLWPSVRGGFGSEIELGNQDDLKRELEALPGKMKYFAEARSYILLYDGNGADKTYKGFSEGGFLATYQKCAHLGCRVPFCESSKWLECPCHGSRYNKAGEYKFGPAPFGLSHFPITVSSSGTVKVNTAAPGAAPPRGIDTIKQEAEGPHC